MNILAIFCIVGSLQAQWTDSTRNRKISVTVAQSAAGGPVLLFFPAVGSGIASYSALLRSPPGYTVVFVQPQYSLKAWANAGKLAAAAQLDFERQEMKDWVKDGLFALARMKAVPAGVFGHGAGGLAAASACQESPLFRACLNMDGETMGSPFVLNSLFEQPFLWLRPLRDATLPPSTA